MSTQQDIYAAGSKSRPPMLNKENYVPWSSRLLRYAKSRPNEKLIHNSILNGPYVRRMIHEPGDANREVNVTETFHLQTDNELSDKELKQIEADDQAIQTILLGLPEDIYAAEKKATLFNEWERFTSNEGELIESYYHCFLKLMNDLKRNKHFPEKIANNLKFLNNLQPEWSRHVTIVHQTKDLHTADYTQLYDFMKYNQKEVDELKDERLAKNQDPLALMANSNNPYLNYSTPTNNNQRISSNPRNRQIAQPVINMGQDRKMQMVGGNGGNQFRQYAGQNAGNPTGYNDVIGNQVIQNAVQNPRVQNDGNQNGLIGVQGNRNQNQIGNEEYDLMAAAANLDKIEEVNANCILMANLQQASTSGTQTDNAFVYDTDGSTEEAAKFVGDFKSLANEDDASLAKHKALELEIERLLKAVVSQDIMSIVQNESVVDTSDLQTELERTKERFKYCIIKKENEYAKLWNDWYKNENTKYAKQPIVENLPKVGKTNALSKSVTSNSVSTPQESKGVNNDKVITPGMFRINPSKTSMEEKHVHNTINNTKTRRPQPKSNTKHDRVPSASKSSRSKNKKAEVEEHHRNLLLSKNNKHISSTCNNIQIDSQDVISKVVCAMCKKYLISVNHDKCLHNYVNGKNSSGKKQKAKVSVKEIQMKYQPKVAKPKKVGTLKDLLHLSLENLDFSLGGHQQADFSKFYLFAWQVIQICLWCVDSGFSKHMTGNLKLLINFVWKFMGTLCFRNDHVAVILGFGDLKWGNILITRVYFIEGLGHILFFVGQFYDSDLEVAFRRNAYFIRNIEGVDLLKGDRSTNLYSVNLNEMASASPICLMAHASSTKSWLWHQRLSHLNFDTINDLARNDLVAGLPKFKYHKEHVCPSCEQGKSKRASHPPNSRKRLHLLHMDLCGPIRITSINGKRYVLVIVDDYSRYTWVHFLRSKDESPEVIIKFLKRITSLQPSDKEIIKTMNVSFDELSAMAFDQRSSKPELQSELDLLFEAMYDDYIGGQPSATARTVPPAQEPQDVDELNPNAMVDGNTFVNPFANSFTSAAASSSSQNVDPSNMHMFYQPYPYEFQWTKDHPLEQVLGEPSQPNVKEAMIDPAWIESMQEELLQFKILDVWVLVPAPDNISPLTLKWLFKKKHDEEQTVIRNKSRLVNYFFKGTIDSTLFIRRFHDDILVDSGFELTGFSDADYAGCKDTFKSTFGGAQFLGEKLVSWSSKKPNCTALSTTEAEYVSLSACCAQVLWMRTQLTAYGFHFNKIPIYCDSKSAIAISCNPIQHSRTKHIAVHYHFIK
nr:retrovirus-related Pol polyprotein from transposon TNT 1-94 [Tanacetum cinerariifolium]